MKRALAAVACILMMALPPIQMGPFNIGVVDEAAADFGSWTAVSSPLVNESYLGAVGVQAWRLSFGCHFEGDSDMQKTGDIVVGAPNGTSTPGTVYVLDGHMPGTKPKGSMWEGNYSFKLRGENNGDMAGYSVACLGDVNGDNFDEIAVGAPLYNGSGTARGKVYILKGSVGGGSYVLNSDSVELASFIGEADLDNLGGAVSAAGDVNRDGYDDILVSAFNKTVSSMTNAGKTYLIFGRPSWSSFRNVSIDAGSNASFVGLSTDAYGGYTLSGDGDVNGDGYGDFMIGSTFHNYGGVDGGGVFLFLGKAAGWAKNVTLTTADVSWMGNVSLERLGIDHSIRGDVDGDGYDDILMSASGVPRGAVYLCYGDPNISTWGRNLTAYSSANSSMMGPGLVGFGQAIEFVGDIDGNGTDEFAIGTPYTSIMTKYGNVYVYPGNASRYPAIFDSTFALMGFGGATSNEAIGVQIGGPGDLDGDGYDDLVFSGRLYSQEQGVTYLIKPFDNPTVTSSENPRVMTEECNGAEIRKVLIGFPFCVRVYSWDANSSLTGVMEIKLFSPMPAPNVATYRLNEAAPGVYEGTLTISDHMDERHGIYRAERGREITISVLKDWTRSVNINVSMAIPLSEAETFVKGSMNNIPLSTDMEILQDIDGDGIDDLAVAQGSGEPDPMKKSQVHIFYGRRSGWDDVRGAGDADATLTTTYGGNFFGNSMSGGDVNGDGIGDLILGAATNGTGLDFWRGKVYVLLGPIDLSGAHDIESVANASFVGEVNYGLGYRIGARGDVNGDGCDDLVMSSIVAPMDMTGWVHIVFGHKGNWTKDMKIKDVADVVMKGEQAMAWTGEQLASDGDANGDGIDDILVSATNWSGTALGAGKAYLVLGRTAWPSTMNLTYDETASYIGSVEQEMLGSSLDFLGNLQGGSTDDIGIGSIYTGKSGNFTGAVRIWYGTMFGPWPKNATGSTAAATLWGEHNSGAYGVLGLGDVNGDGTGDFLQAAQGMSEMFNQNGMVTVVASPHQPKGYDNFTKVGQPWAGISGDDNIGETFGGGGDLDGDGRDDFVVGSRDVAPGSWSPDRFGGFYFVTPYPNHRPSTVQNLTLQINEGSVWVPATIVQRDRQVRVILNGTDTDPLSRDTAEVTVRSAAKDPGGIRLRLFETGDATGSYEGYFSPRDLTHEGHHWIGAKGGDTVTVTSVDTPSIFRTIRIDSDPRIYPESAPAATEDVFYQLNFTFTGTVNVTNWGFAVMPGIMGWATWNATNASLYGTPNNTAVGMNYFTLNITDDLGKLEQRDFFLIVGNAAPKILPFNTSNLTEEVPFTIDMACDDDGQGEINWSLTTNASSWVMFNNTTGIINGTPDDAQVGPWWFNMTVTDDHGGAATTNFTLNVTPVDDAPVITSTPVTEAYIGSIYTYQVTATDIDGPALGFGLDIKPKNMTIALASGLISWTPMEGELGNHSVVVNVTDGPRWAVQEFNITVKPVLYIPTTVLESPANGSALDIRNPELRWKVSDPWVTYDVYLSQSEGDVRGSAQAAALATGLNETRKATSGLVPGATYFWTVVPKDVANDTLGICLSGIRSFSILPGAIENHAPTINGTPPVLAFLGTEYSYMLNATDEDSYDLGKLTFSIVAGPTTMLISSMTGLISWVPKPNEIGNWTVTARVEDTKGATADLTWRLEAMAVANKAPIFDPVLDQELTVGELWTYQVKATDPEGQPPVYSISDGKRTGMEINNATGLISWTPSTNDVGKFIITIAATDGYLTTYLTINITVSAPGGGGGGDGGTSPLDLTVAGIPLMVLLAIVIIIVFALAGAIYASKRKKDKALEDRLAATEAAVGAVAAKTEKEAEAKGVGGLTVDDLFVIFKDGRLLYHHTRRLKPDMDGDLLSGMFTAVQEFVSGSFRPESEEIKVAVNEIRYADYRILIEHGEFLFVAVSAQGDNVKPTIALMKQAVKNMETEYKEVLATWTGEVELLKGVKKYLLGIIAGSIPEPPAPPVFKPVEEKAVPKEEVPTPQPEAPPQEVETPAPIEDAPPPPPAPPPTPPKPKETPAPKAKAPPKAEEKPMKEEKKQEKKKEEKKDGETGDDELDALLKDLGV